jgi:hypothetical protein
MVGDRKKKSVFIFFTSMKKIIIKKMSKNIQVFFIFVGNNTCHASLKNSAPGQVFAFYGFNG